MPRIFFPEQTRNDYFRSLRTISGLSWEGLSKDLKISNRHLRDIRRGIYSLPKGLAESIENKYGLSLPDKILLRQDLWHIKKAAKLGGKKRVVLYGPPGTLEGRRKGGINSIRVHKRLKSNFILSKAIKYPHNSADLAELIGALLGDGGISLRQVKISLNMHTDKDYANYLTILIQELFAIKVFLLKRKAYSTISLVVSSTKLVFFLKRKGLPVGNKIKQKLDIPLWIYQRKSWQRACLRGLFDTDGCTYIDYHTYKDRKYGHIAVAFRSYSEPLIQSIHKILNDLGYTPTISTKYSILLRRENEILKFFQEIKPSNNRHVNILNKFLEGYRSGHNGAVSKAAVA